MLLQLLTDLLLLPQLAKLCCFCCSLNCCTTSAAIAGTTGAAGYKHFVILTSSQLKLPVSAGTDATVGRASTADRAAVNAELAASKTAGGDATSNYCLC